MATVPLFSGEAPAARLAWKRTALITLAMVGTAPLGDFGGSRGVSEEAALASSAGGATPLEVAAAAGCSPPRFEPPLWRDASVPRFAIKAATQAGEAAVFGLLAPGRPCRRPDMLFSTRCEGVTYYLAALSAKVFLAG